MQNTILLGVIGLVGWVSLVGSHTPAHTESGQSPIYIDFHLTEHRICKQCSGQWTADQRILLTNRQGQRTVVHPREILGVDRHPVGRRLFRNSLHGIGLPAKIIVPYAFDDYRDYVCKYCDP